MQSCRAPYVSPLLVLVGGLCTPLVSLYPLASRLLSCCVVSLTGFTAPVSSLFDFKLENLSPNGGVFSPRPAPVEIRVDGEKCPYGRWRICVLSA